MRGPLTATRPRIALLEVSDSFASRAGETDRKQVTRFSFPASEAPTAFRALAWIQHARGRRARTTYPYAGRCRPMTKMRAMFVPERPSQGTAGGNP